MYTHLHTRGASHAHLNDGSIPRSAARGSTALRFRVLNGHEKVGIYHGLIGVYYGFNMGLYDDNGMILGLLWFTLV